MNIYFATSIRGTSSEDAFKNNCEFIDYLKKYGTVLTEHFSNPEIKKEGETELNEIEIHDRDINWISDCDIVIAEVSNPSLGVGYEIRFAVENNKKVLCLYKKQNKKLSAMIRGCRDVTVENYTDINEAFGKIEKFIKNGKQKNIY